MTSYASVSASRRAKMADGVVNKIGDAETNVGQNGRLVLNSPENDSSSEQLSDSVGYFREPVLAEINHMANENIKKIYNSIRNGGTKNEMSKLDETENFGPLPMKETDLQKVISYLEDCILYEDSCDLVKTVTNLRELDDIGKFAVISHSIAAFISTLDSSHSRNLSTRIISDTGLWISRLFRFVESSPYIHEDPRDGLLRICRMVLHQRYPKFAAEGYEALYSRPPVIYVSSAAKSGLGQYLCTQLGLPLANLTVVPCNTVFGSNFKMDIAALESLIHDDIAAQKVPLIVIAMAGTPIVGHVDNLQRLQEITRSNNIWLHVEGHSLAALCLLSTPNLMDPDAWPSDTVSAVMFNQPTKISDSMTIPLGTWLGIPSVPFVTLFKTMDPALMHSAGLTYNNYLRLTCLPLWVTLQCLGTETIIQRIKNAFDMSKFMQQKLFPIENIKLLGKQAGELAEETKFTVSDMLNKPVNITTLFDVLLPTVVFQYADPQDETTLNENTELNLPKRNHPYYNNLNSWLGQILQRDLPRIQLDIVDLDNYGVCVRFCALESTNATGIKKEDIEEFTEFLLKQVAILNATVKYKKIFYTLASKNPNLEIVEIANWAGLGGLRYIPTHLLQNVTDLPDSGKEDINRLNRELVIQLKNTDSAFSIGEGKDGLACVRFGMVTEDTEIEELITLVLNTGKEVEESSKYLETMAEMIKKGIETANQDLKKENEEKIWQEGLLRQVPLVGTFVNWWSPLPKETGIKGRSFNLQSGVIESTENIYRYHMQIQEGSPKASPTTPRPSVQTPVRVSPQHSRSSSKSSVSSKQGTQNSTVNTNTAIITEKTEQQQVN